PAARRLARRSSTAGGSIRTATKPRRTARAPDLPRDMLVGESAHRPSARDRLIDVQDRLPPSAPAHHVYVRYAHDSISLSRLSHTSGTERKVTTGLMHRLLVSHTSRQGKGPEPLLDEPTNLLVVSEHQRTPVALPRLVGAAEAAEHVGPSQMKGGVPLQGAG